MHHLVDRRAEVRAERVAETLQRLVLDRAMLVFRYQGGQAAELVHAAHVGGVVDAGFGQLAPVIVRIGMAIGDLPAQLAEAHIVQRRHELNRVLGRDAGIVAHRCIPQRRTVTSSILRKITLSTSRPIMMTMVSPANT